jgi:signal transduction histidine kinase
VRHRTRRSTGSECFSRLYDQERLVKEELEVEVQKRTEALRQAYEKIERLDQTKTDFINVTAHELRTPLTIIMGYAQLLRGVEGKERFVQGIIAGANHLLEIINTMLMMAKIDSRALKIYPEPLSVQSLMQNVLVNLGTAIAEATVSMKIWKAAHSLRAMWMRLSWFLVILSRMLSSIRRMVDAFSSAAILDTSLPRLVPSWRPSR